MFAEMRRKDREISKEETIEVLEKAEYGILSTMGTNGYPYGIPIIRIDKGKAPYLPEIDFYF